MRPEERVLLIHSRIYRGKLLYRKLVWYEYGVLVEMDKHAGDGSLVPEMMKNSAE